MNANPFALGVASGSPGHDSVVLWTRLVHEALANAGNVTVRWELAHDKSFKQIVLKGQAEAVPELAHSVHVEAAGLGSARSYFYRFMTAGAGNDWVSTVGRTRTLPEPDAPLKRLRLAYASCQRFEHGYFTAWRHLVADKPDMVLFHGDYIYEYAGASNAVRRHTDGWALDLNSYRKRYALHKLDADLQAAHAACPWFFIWDDHEVQNEYAGLNAGDSGPPVPDFAARRAAAYQAWYEHMPVRASVLTRALEGLASGAPMRIHGGVRFGRLASMALLDTRQYRDARVCTKGNPAGSSTVDPASCESWMDPKRSMLGIPQEKWLTKHLSRHANSVTWNVIAQTTIFGQRDFRSGPGESLWNDAWDGYASARKRLMDALASHRVGNAVLLGGDVHQNWVGHVKADYANPRSAAVGVEFCGTSITSRSGGNAKIAQHLAENPHFIYAEGERKGYGIADFTPRQMTVALRVVDNVALQNTKIETLARFAVQAGRAKVELA